MTQGLLWAMKIFLPVENQTRQNTFIVDIILGIIFCYESCSKHGEKTVIKHSLKGSIKVYHLGAEDKPVCYFNIFEISFSQTS